MKSYGADSNLKGVSYSFKLKLPGGHVVKKKGVSGDTKLVLVSPMKVANPIKVDELKDYEFDEDYDTFLVPILHPAKEEPCWAYLNFRDKIIRPLSGWTPFKLEKKWIIGGEEIKIEKPLKIYSEEKAPLEDYVIKQLVQANSALGVNVINNRSKLSDQSDGRLEETEAEVDVNEWSAIEIDLNEGMEIPDKVIERAAEQICCDKVATLMVYEDAGTAVIHDDPNDLLEGVDELDIGSEGKTLEVTKPSFAAWALASVVTCCVEETVQDAVRYVATSLLSLSCFGRCFKGSTGYNSYSKVKDRFEKRKNHVARDICNFFSRGAKRKTNLEDESMSLKGNLGKPDVSDSSTSSGKEEIIVSSSL